MSPEKRISFGTVIKIKGFDDPRVVTDTSIDGGEGWIGTNVLPLHENRIANTSNSLPVDMIESVEGSMELVEIIYMLNQAFINAGVKNGMSKELEDIYIGLSEKGSISIDVVE